MSTSEQASTELFDEETCENYFIILYDYYNALYYIITWNEAALI
jgi:hypothetical protein